MPTYEMPLLLRTMKRPELVTVLKRTAEAIFDQGGFIRKIDNLGKLPTPYKMSANSRVHREANYFIFHFDVPPANLITFQNVMLRDVDVVRSRIYRTNEDPKVECTLHEELLPPPYRPEVQKMIQIGEEANAKKERFKFKLNTGLDYYPFQR